MPVSELELPGEPTRPVREGLPSSYRMRADGHYLDFLAAREPEEEQTSPAATCAQPEVPQTSPPPDPTGHLGEAIARSIGTAASLAELLTSPLSDLSRSGIGTLLRAELSRASAVVQAARVIRGELPMMRGAVPVAALVDRVLQGFASERRLRHVDIAVHVDLPHAHIVIADEQLLTSAMNGAVLATLALLEGLPASRMLVVAGLTAGRQLTLLVSQDHVLPPTVWADRAFDASWNERAGGAAITLAMASLQQAARAHGGEATATLSPRGTRLGLTIPAGA